MGTVDGRIDEYTGKKTAGAEKMGIIDAKSTLEKVLAENLGLPEYEYIIEIYGKIEDWYKDYLTTAEAEENIRIFDEILPGYSWISSVKKVDYIIWGQNA